tara:strand:+ start:352 stop:1197 length:846 start_codon:yes stop_codon:yes gene_type:complete
MSQLFLGLDPDISLFPSPYINASNIDVQAWGEDVIQACLGKIRGVKFQSAYFENMGLKGLSALSQLIKFSRDLGLITIMDAKRGDIGSTSKAYAEAYLSNTNAIGNDDFSCDYLTVNPLMGEDCLDPFVEIALKHKKGLFILLETSNPGASMILKQSMNDAQQVNMKIADYISSILGSLDLLNGDMGPIGVVIGATNSNIDHWREKLPHSIFLMPGIGAQGGEWDTIRAGLNSKGEGVWVPISRGITQVKKEVSNKSAYIDEVKHNIRHHYDAMQKTLQLS